MVREDEFDDWERLHEQAVRMNKDSLLVAESYEKERIKKYLACCECPADFEMSVTQPLFRSRTKGSIIFIKQNLPNDKLKKTFIKKLNSS